MAGTKFSGFIPGPTTANTRIVGYDAGASTNNQYTLGQLAAGISPSLTIDTIFTTPLSSTVPTGQTIDLTDSITFNHTAGASAEFLWKTTSGYGDLAMLPAGLAPTPAGSTPGLYWKWGTHTNMIRTYTSGRDNIEIGPGGTANVSINPWVSFWTNTAGLTVASTSATTTGVQIRGGSDADTSKALLVENDSGTETFSVRDDGLVSIAVEATIPKRKFEITSAQPAYGDADGDIVYFGTGTTVIGKLYYFDGTDWLATDAAAGVGAGAEGLLGIGMGTTPATDGMLIRGMVTLQHDPGTIGNTLYMAPAAAPPLTGMITDTIPSVSGETVRIVGYCMDSAGYQIWFNPSSTAIELA